MLRLLIVLCVLLAAGCSENLRSSRAWAEVRQEIRPDQTSGAICRLLGAIPCHDGRDGFSWALADGWFSGVFYADPPGDPRLLHGRFHPDGPAQACPQPSAEDIAAAQRLQAHWRQPDPDIRSTVRRMRDMAGVDADAKAHAERLGAAFERALDWKLAGGGEALPISTEVQVPGDLDLLWAGFYATGDDRFLAALLHHASGDRPGLVFPARWSLECNLRQDPAIRARLAAMPVPAEAQRLAAILLQRNPG